MTSRNFILVFLLIQTAAAQIPKSFAGAIAVPGTHVSLIRLLDNFAASCTKDKNGLAIDQLAGIMKSFNAEDVVKKIYDSLFSSIGDVDLEKLEGNWYTIVDSSDVHPEPCIKTEIQIISRAPFTGTFAVKTTTYTGSESKVYTGFGTQTGPDPGELLIATGHPRERCPYLPVKVFASSPGAPYEYIVLSQPLKHPTMVWARRSEILETRQKEINDFLERHGYMSPITALNSRLQFTNVSWCGFQ
ncbi:unnamed protein product, partial [Mesorhabditis belari]|uniref:Lipocalin domain-containing protein n=1 Tax=Mesorhabditis belari TaxID=2138241 RepID=A0AAF3ET59_9BILA